MFIKCLITALLLLFAAFNSSRAEDSMPVCPSDMVTEAKVDLNGDGKIDDVKLILPPNEGSSDFELKINDVSIKDSHSYPVNGMLILDIDKSDKYQEVAVYTEGPSSDDDYFIFWYDGKRLKKMADIQRWPKFPGNGIVYVDDHMGFWVKREKYVLNQKTRALELVPQELYYVGSPAKVVETFPIYRTRQESKIVANLIENSEILVLAYAPAITSEELSRSADNFFKDWYLIKTSTKLVGWSRLENFWNKVQGLPWAD